MDKQVYVFKRDSTQLGRAAMIEFVVVARSLESAREVLREALSRSVLTVNGRPVPVDLSPLWARIEPAFLGPAADDEEIGVVGIRSEGLTSRTDGG